MRGLFKVEPRRLLKAKKFMARLPYSNMEPFAELLRQSGLPENTSAASAFRMFAHAPAVGAATLRLVFALLTETELDPVSRELVILRW